MAKKDKAGGKKRDAQAEAAASEKPLKKAKQEKKAEEPAAASEEESEELEIPEDFEEESEEGSDSEVRRCLAAGWLLVGSSSTHRLFWQTRSATVLPVAEVGLIIRSIKHMHAVLLTRSKLPGCSG
jgi:hypothetical protein